MADWFWGGLMIAGLIYWMWKANHPKKASPPTPEPISFVKGPGRPAELPVDPFIEEFTRTRLQAEEQAKQEASAYKAKIESEVASDEKLKQRLTKVAIDNALERALPKLYEEIKHYPAWSQREDWPKYNKLSMSGLREEKPEKGSFGDGTVFFTYQGAEYGIHRRSWSGMESESYVDLTLFENGEDVFGGSYGYEYDYVASYRFIDLKAFKKRGNWATMLVTLSAKIDLESEKSSADFRAQMASDIKSKFAE